MLSAACVKLELDKLYRLFGKFASLMQEAACEIRGFFSHINDPIASHCAKAGIY